MPEEISAVEFEVGDAADLSRFNSSSFEAVVMAFNAIDYLVPDEPRHRPRREIGRVLKAEGILIFSSHNPRSMCVRVSFNPQRVRDLAETMLPSDFILYRPLLLFLIGLRVILTRLRAVLRSVRRAVWRVVTQAFWNGQGDLTDPAHGGRKIHFSAPEKVACELGRFGFRLLRLLGHDYLQPSRRHITEWYYYVSVKTGVTQE